MFCNVIGLPYKLFTLDLPNNIYFSGSACVRACMRACVRACVLAYMRAFLRACVLACVCVCVFLGVP